MSINKTFALAITALVAAVVITARPFGRTSTVLTSGECIASVERDRTAITVRVTVVDPDAASSLRRAKAAYGIVAEYTQSIDDDTMEMQTARFDSHERNRWDHNRQEEIFVGFETNIELVISSDRRDKIEEVMSAFAGRPNIFPGNLRMFSSPRKIMPAIENCIQTAVEHARSNANSIAAADGRRVGRMVSAEFSRIAGPGDIQPRPMMMRQAAALGGGVGADSGISLFATDSEISVTVTATFELK
ncbi:MAG: SIMPL domain-containing protein [Alphaproteobacteria bacterium]|nr:SIMPL domain-containing protein [Alphaproteobacteria bacterium]